MKKLSIIIFLSLFCSFSIVSQKIHFVNGEVKGIIQDNIITSHWTDEDEASTASLYLTNVKTKKRLLIAKDLWIDQVQAIDNKKLLYTDERKLLVADIISGKSSVLYQTKGINDIVGIAIDPSKKNVYMVETNRDRNVFQIVYFNLSSRKAEIMATTPIDLDYIELFANADIYIQGTHVYIMIDFTLYDFDIPKKQLHKIDSAITEFALADEQMYFLKNYKEDKTKLEVVNLSNKQRSIIDKVGKNKIEESIYTCKNTTLATSIVHDKYLATLNYCDNFYNITGFSFIPTDKFILFENEKLIVFKMKQTFSKKISNYIIKP